MTPANFPTVSVDRDKATENPRQRPRDGDEFADIDLERDAGPDLDLARLAGSLQVGRRDQRIAGRLRQKVRNLCDANLAEGGPSALLQVRQPLSAHRLLYCT